MGFFNDLSKKASETYKTTAEKTSKITKEMKLKSLMNDNKTKIQNVYADIGKKVYEKHLLDEEIDVKTSFVEEISKIDAYAQEIEDIRIELLELKDLKMCKVCAAEINVDAKFCPKCGATQQQDSSEEKVFSDVDEGENSEVKDVEVVNVESVDSVENIVNIENAEYVENNINYGENHSEE